MAVHSSIRDEDRAKKFILFGAEEELKCEEKKITNLFRKFSVS